MPRGNRSMELVLRVAIEAHLRGNKKRVQIELIAPLYAVITYDRAGGGGGELTTSRTPAFTRSCGAVV